MESAITVMCTRACHGHAYIRVYLLAEDIEYSEKLAFNIYFQVNIYMYNFRYFVITFASCGRNVFSTP